MGFGGGKTRAIPRMEFPGWNPQDERRARLFYRTYPRESLAVMINH